MLNSDLFSNHLTPILPLKTSMEQHGEPKKKIEGVLFDIYGTLFISSSGDISIARKQSVQQEKLTALLKKYAISCTPQALVKDFFNAIEEKHKELKEKGIDFPEVEIDRIWCKILNNDDMDVIKAFAIEYELIVNPVYPMPHLEEMLKTLRDKGLLMGIISNAQFFTPELFHYFLGSYPENIGFNKDLIYYSYKYRHAKPSSFLYQLAVKEIEKSGMSVHSVIYVGNDMLKDIYAAQKAGFQTALFAGDSRSLRLRKNDPNCNTLSPDIIITDLIQLLDYI